MPTFLYALLALVALAACNTVAGAGEDLSAAGGAISEEAAETQSDM